MRTKSAWTLLATVWVLLALVGALSCGGSSVNEKPLAPTPLRSGTVAARSLPFNGSNFLYYLYVPRSYDGLRALPSVLLVHGANGNGGDFIKSWEDQAEKSGIALLAPTVPEDAGFEPQIPKLFRALMEAAKTEVKLDPKRMYLFGYSAGGYATYDAAMFDSTYFAGAGVFAGIITPDYDWIVDKAQRKTAVAIYIGDRDQFFTFAQTRRTRDLLLSHGFPVHYVEIAHQDHNYGAVEDTVNADAWNYLRQYSLSP